MTIDEIKRQIFIDSEEVCGDTMIDTCLAQEYVERAYNKAIDEAICKVEKHKTNSYVTGITNNPFEFGACQMADDIVKILEQLKAGGENDN